MNRTKFFHRILVLSRLLGGVALIVACGGGVGAEKVVQTEAELAAGQAVEASYVIVDEDTEYRYQPILNQENGTNLSFSIQNQPVWAAFNTATGELSGIPRNRHVGFYPNIAISVHSGEATTELPAFSIEVRNTNDPPVIWGTPPVTANAGAMYQFIPTVRDMDGDELHFSIVNRPPWAAFNVNTGELSGVPANEDAGLYKNISILVTDGTVVRVLPDFLILVKADPLSESPGVVISGNPATSVAVNQSYLFQPTVQGPAQVGDDVPALVFNIVNQPSWATFDPATGQLSGIPLSKDLGTTSNIVISVFDGSTIDSLPPFNITVTGKGGKTGSASLSWQVPVEREDGEPLALSEIDGYRIYYGNNPNDYQYSLWVPSAMTTAYSITDLKPGAYYFAVTTLDTDGRESDYSDEVQKIVQ